VSGGWGRKKGHAATSRGPKARLRESPRSLGRANPLVYARLDYTPRNYALERARIRGAIHRSRAINRRAKYLTGRRQFGDVSAEASEARVARPIVNPRGDSPRLCYSPHRRCPSVQERWDLHYRDPGCTPAQCSNAIRSTGRKPNSH